MANNKTNSKSNGKKYNDAQREAFVNTLHMMDVCRFKNTKTRKVNKKRVELELPEDLLKFFDQVLDTLEANYKMDDVPNNRSQFVAGMLMWLFNQKTNEHGEILPRDMKNKIDAFMYFLEKEDDIQKAGFRRKTY
jgi:uncharacterized Fe-S cluster-containing protein